MKVMLFIRSLNAGGAERQVVLIAKGLSERGHNVTLLTFYDGGFYCKELKGSSVKHISLNKSGRWDVVRFFLRLGKVVREENPDVFYSFLGVENIIGLIMNVFVVRNAPIVWGVRASNVDLDQYDWMSRCVYKLECLLARFADLIISNSHAGKNYAVSNGFPARKLIVIHNGIDTNLFIPNKSSGKRLREEWGIKDDQILVGAVGRIDPMKGIPVFLRAAKLIKKRSSRVRFVWVGDGDMEYKKSMKNLSEELGIDDILIWAGRRSDMVSVYNAFDVAVSSSYGEGFPNVVGEAMACGVPCVVTNVGDSAVIVDNPYLVTTQDDPEALSSVILKLIHELSSHNWADVVRGKIVEKYSLNKMIYSTEKALEKAVYLRRRVIPPKSS